MRVLMVLTSHDQLGNTGRKTEGFRELVEDCLWGICPDEGRRRFIVGFDVAGDLGFELGHGPEDAASDFSTGDGREDAFDRVQP